MSSYKRTVITLCYNNLNIITKSIEQYYALCKNSPDVHFFVDNNYPIEKEKTSQGIEELAKKYNGRYINLGKNLGIREGLKTVYQSFDFQDNDRILFYDSNANPLTKDFDDYLYKILDTEQYAYSATTFPINAKIVPDYDELQIEFEKDPIHGIEFFKNKPELQRIPGVFSTIGCYRFAMTKIVDVNFFDMYNVFFGELLNTYNRVKETINNSGMEPVYLKNVNENFELTKLEDSLYRRYKIFIGSLRPFNHIPFEEFIQKPQLINTELLINNQVSAVNRQIQHLNNILL